MIIKPNNKKYYGKKWKKLSQSIIKSRGETCERCGIKRNSDEPSKGWLTVHHKDRNPANNNPDNLMVLCPKCHFHMEYLINRGYFNPNQILFFEQEGILEKYVSILRW